MITVEPLALRPVLAVCERMRQQDWEEVLNALPKSVTRAETVAMIVMQSKLGWVASIDGDPAGVLQLGEILDGTWRIGMFGTNRMPEVAAALACQLADIVPDLFEDGARYCEAHADALHAEAHKFLTFVGFRKRAILPGYGSHGADIALFTFTKDDQHVFYGRRWRQLRNFGAHVSAGNGGDPVAAGIS
jgi:hypothetical protein